MFANGIKTSNNNSESKYWQIVNGRCSISVKARDFFFTCALKFLLES